MGRSSSALARVRRPLHPLRPNKGTSDSTGPLPGQQKHKLREEAQSVAEAADQTPGGATMAATPTCLSAPVNGVGQQDGGSLQQLVAAFNSRAAELGALAALKVDDRTRIIYAEDIASLEATVSALESTLKSVQEVVAKERAALPRAQMLMQAAHEQKKAVQHMEENLPSYLLDQAAGRTGSDTKKLNQPGGAAAHAENAAGTVTGREAQQSALATRRFITQAELDSVSSYMRGRLTLEKVNEALEELCGHADRVAKVTSSQKSGSARQNSVLAKRIAVLQQRLQKSQKAALKGKFWLTESCVKEGSHIRMDKSGRSLLTLFRHLGRLHEIRVTKGGPMETVYVLLE
mmetsp:Transcript_22574/g.62670  ORF Transcript_22574/g.62670 Transcript_22574/m.62670 type:complete len:347 (+) Transcript_22574:252-1292(+)